MMQTPDYRSFFDTYAATMIEALDDEAGIETMQTAYAEAIIGAAPGGFVNAMQNDETLGAFLKKNQGFYKAIGLRNMEVLDVAVSPIDEGHDSVKVAYRASCRKRDGEAVSTDFSITYMLQNRENGPKIFAFVTGDEMGLYKELGLVDAEGKPA